MKWLYLSLMRLAKPTSTNAGTPKSAVATKKVL
jgi:hypothetical protein